MSETTKTDAAPSKRPTRSRAKKALSKNATILVTGAGGTLAKLVIERLKQQYQVIAVDFRRRVELDQEIPSYCVDFNKRGFEDIFRNHDIEGVVHLGRLLTHESNRFNRYNANVLGTQKLFDLCLKYNVRRVCVLSTYFCYGATAFNPARLDEAAPLKAAELTMDLIDAVELENLATIHLWKNPELNITLLRPCNIIGPNVRNNMSLLLSQKTAPVMLGFSPMMQFIHVEDTADAIVLAFNKNKPGIYNVAPEDWIGYQQAVEECGCNKLSIPAIPPTLPRRISKWLKWKAFPGYLVNYLKYPVVIDGSRFAETFGFAPQRSLEDSFRHYRDKKRQKKIKPKPEPKRLPFLTR